MIKLKVLLFVIITVFSMSAVVAQTKPETKEKHANHAVQYQCPMHCEGDKTYDKAGKCTVCGMALKKVDTKAAAYQCPMKCEGDKMYAEEGKCPVCKMKLSKQKVKKTA